MRSALLLLAATSALGGCDPQATTAYQGEPMFSFDVKVDPGDVDASEKLVPALAFRNRMTGVIDIVDVAVRGEFPARFTVDVRGVPPETAFSSFWSERGEPELAYALIAAAKADHPESIKSIGFTWGSAHSCSEEGCTKVNGYCTEAVPIECANRHPFQANDCYTGECYEEHLLCKPPGPNDGSCTIESTTGDREIKYGFAETFAGVASNYAVIYAKDDLAADTATAAVLGEDEGLPAGYHLFELRDPDTTRPEFTACVEAVEKLALAELNALNNSNHEVIKQFSDDCDEMPGCFPQELVDEYDALFFGLQYEMRCAAALDMYTRVEGDLSKMEISLEITNDLDQLTLPL